MKGKIKFNEVPCKRCETPMSVRTDPIVGLTSIQEELSGICHRCLSPEEFHKITKAYLIATTRKTLDKQYDT